MGRINKLPYWALTETRPAFYDYESASAIDQTAKIYGAMQGIIEDYNKFSEELNQAITDYENGLTGDFECFKAKIIKLVHDYIAMLDEKLKLQDSIIENNLTYIRDNLESIIVNLFTELYNSGELAADVSVSYDNNEESLMIKDTMSKAEDGAY